MDDSAFAFRRHARNRLRWLRDEPEAITAEDVLATLRHPDAVTPTIEGRSNAWRYLGPRWLRVTHIIEDDLTVIISVMVKRTGPH
jgi:hypothetical protein